METPDPELWQEDHSFVVYPVADLPACIAQKSGILVFLHRDSEYEHRLLINGGDVLLEAFAAYKPAHSGDALPVTHVACQFYERPSVEVYRKVMDERIGKIAYLGQLAKRVPLKK